MRLERLTYNKIKIFLPFDDLSERGLTKDDLWKNAPKVQQLFHDMMYEASVELGFEADGPIAIEIFSLQAQGMVIIVTKDRPDSDLDDEYQDDYIEMQVTLDESDDILYELANFEDVIALANYLYPQGFTNGRLYSFNERFYLLFDEEVIPESKDTFIAILAEYGNSSTITKYRLAEYGKELIRKNAIETIQYHFSI